MNSPKGILFDLGGTLLKEGKFDVQAGRQRMFELAKNPRGVSFEEIRETADLLFGRIQEQRETGLIEAPFRCFNRLIHEMFGIRFSLSGKQLELEFWKAANVMSPAAGVEKAVAQLAERGLPMGIVSNCMFYGGVLKWELAVHHLVDYFDFIISSADFGFRKPHRGIFLAAAGKLNLAPTDVWFLGDSLKKDVAGAQSAGITGVWYNPDGETAGDVRPDAEFKHWDDFLGLVDGVL
jgi:HAD superfamily hydrolase (TIGR01549 family)